MRAPVALNEPNVPEDLQHNSGKHALRESSMATVWRNLRRYARSGKQAANPRIRAVDAADSAETGTSKLLLGHCPTSVVPDATTLILGLCTSFRAPTGA